MTDFFGRLECVLLGGDVVRALVVGSVGRPVVGFWSFMRITFLMVLKGILVDMGGLIYYALRDILYYMDFRV